MGSLLYAARQRRHQPTFGYDRLPHRFQIERCQHDHPSRTVPKRDIRLSESVCRFCTHPMAASILPIRHRRFESQTERQEICEKAQTRLNYPQSRPPQNQRRADERTALFNVAGEKQYLFPVMDLFNGEMVSYRIQARPTFDLVGIMLKEAFKTLMPSEKPILYSDQGWQYRMRLYCQQLEDRGWVQSMLRWGG